VNKLVALAIVAAVSPAAAEPCDVRIRFAPDDVGATVASWLRDEERCGAPLEVRIVSTPEGLYVFARDANGRVRERVVPDAQSAGVLIASWAAADAPAAPPARVPAAPGFVSPSESLPVDRVDVRSVARERRSEKTLAVHAMVNDQMRGIRGELDIAKRGALIGGAVLSIAHDGHTDWENRGHDVLDYVDIKAMAQLGIAGEESWVRGQASVAAGVLVTYLKSTNYFTDAPMPVVTRFDALSASPALDVTASLGARLAPRWYLEAGVLVTVLTQSYWSPLANTEIESRGLEALLFTGLRYAR
jgi:hypothetical protein